MSRAEEAKPAAQFVNASDTGEIPSYNGDEKAKATDFANYFCSYAQLYHQKQMLAGRFCHRLEAELLYASHRLESLTPSICHVIIYLQTTTGWLPTILPFLEMLMFSRTRCVHKTSFRVMYLSVGDLEV